MGCFGVRLGSLSRDRYIHICVIADVNLLIGFIYLMNEYGAYRNSRFEYPGHYF